jgi:Recombination endonuclease VII
MNGETKVCRTCGETKPLDEFSSTLRVRTKVPSRLTYSLDCKPCASKKSYAHQRGAGAAVQTAYRQSEEYKRSQKDGWLRLNYHKSLEWFEKKLAEQNGVCAICGNPEVRKTPKGEVKSLAVDHDHKCCPGHRSCGECVRGLICEKCNHALGQTSDDVVILGSAISYLTQFQKV